jgi:uncharacterized protein YndB with AHSA1/START domain
MSTDRIEKQVVLKAPRERVWQAIVDSNRFGTWFGIAFDGPFVAGQRVAGRIVPTRVDPEIALLQEPWDGMACDFHVECIEPMSRFTFRWHAYPEGPDEDPQGLAMTLVEFELEDHGDDTRLRICESGFDRVPLAYRAKAFAENEGGWAMQIELISKYLALPA